MSNYLASDYKTETLAVYGQIHEISTQADLVPRCQCLRMLDMVALPQLTGVKICRIKYLLSHLQTSPQSHRMKNFRTLRQQIPFPETIEAQGFFLAP